MITGVAVLVAVMLAALGLLHVVWAFGARPLPAAVIPSAVNGAPVLNPGPAITLLVAGLLLFAASLLLDQVGLGLQLLPPGLTRLGSMGVAGALLLRGIGDFRYVGLFRRVRSTPFARLDTWVYTPLVLTLAGLIGWVVLGVE